MIMNVFAQNDFGDTMSDGLAGPMGLLIIVLLAIATVLLIRNMNSRLRRLPERFGEPANQPGEAGGPAAVGGGSASGAGGSADGPAGEA